MASSTILSYDPYSRNRDEEIQCTEEYIYLYEEYRYLYKYMCIYMYEVYMSSSLTKFPRTEVAWRSEALWGVKGNRAMNSLSPSTPNSVALTHRAHALRSGSPCLPPPHTPPHKCWRLPVWRSSQTGTATQTRSIWRREGESSPSQEQAIFSRWIVRSSFYYARLLKTWCVFAEHSLGLIF